VEGEEDQTCKPIGAGHTRPFPAVPGALSASSRTAGETASACWGGDCALAGGDLGGSRPRVRSTSSAAPRLLMTATTRCLPPQGHSQTSTSKVLRCKARPVQSRPPRPLRLTHAPGAAPGQRRCGHSLVLPRPHHPCTQLRVRREHPVKPRQVHPLRWDERHQPLHQPLRRELQHLPLPRPVLVAAILTPRQPLQHRHPPATPLALRFLPERQPVLHPTAAKLPGLVLAGSAYRGVGVNDCLREAERLALVLAPGAASDSPR
jgi:hypothetical protein